MACKAEEDGANALFLMATGDYPLGKYIELSKEVKSRLQQDTVMMANIGDFKDEEAEKLKEAGFMGIYHAVRTGEGRDTKIPPETRLKTIQAAKGAALQIGTCVEPIGPEHSVEEIAEKIIIGRKIKPCYSGAMRRIWTMPSPFGKSTVHRGSLDSFHQSFIQKITRSFRVTMMKKKNILL